MKKKEYRLFMPSVGRCLKAVLLIIVICVAAGFITAFYDVIVSAFAGLIVGIF